MNTIQVASNVRIIYINEDRERFYVVYDNEGNAHTFSDFGNLGNHGFHSVVDAHRMLTENECEFLGGQNCYTNSRTTGPMHDENEIFEMLEASAQRVNEMQAVHS